MISKFVEFYIILNFGNCKKLTLESICLYKYIWPPKLNNSFERSTLWHRQILVLFNECIEYQSDTGLAGLHNETFRGSGHRTPLLQGE